MIAMDKMYQFMRVCFLIGLQLIFLAFIQINPQIGSVFVACGLLTFYTIEKALCEPSIQTNLPCELEFEEPNPKYTRPVSIFGPLNLEDLYDDYIEFH